MNATALDLTRDGLITALKPRLYAKTQPTLLRDALKMKRARGDADADQFRDVAVTEFAYRLNSTIQGAANAMRQMIAKRKPWVSDRQHADRIAFLADLDAIQDGSFGDYFTAEAP